MVIAVSALLLATPCIIAFQGAEAEATSVSPTEMSVSDIRDILASSGYDVSGYSDTEIEERFGWFANKNLIGKYEWNDPTGINYLLEKAGIEGGIDAIILAGEGVSLVVGGVAYAITGSLLSAGIVGWFLAAGLFVYAVYDTIMSENALEKAEYAIQLVSQQKNYAVYETTVLWNLMANGYDVEEW